MPEQRADKNGKLVVRHVKTTTGGKPQMASIPAPSLGGREELASEVIKREFLSFGLSEQESNDYVEYTGKLGIKTQEAVAEALKNRRDDEELKAVKHIIAVAMEPGVVQLAVSDLDFFLKIRECFPVNERLTPQRAAFNAIESVFRNNFKTALFQDRVNDFDYLKYAVPFRAEVISVLLQLKDRAVSSFDEREQEEHIKEHLEEFTDNIAEHRRVSFTLHDYAINPTSRDLLSISKLVKEHGSTTDAVIEAIIERRRYEEDEIRSILSSAPALSQGVI